jgi:hypothetical protein
MLPIAGDSKSLKVPSVVRADRALGSGSSGIRPYRGFVESGSYRFSRRSLFWMPFSMSSPRG